MPLLVIELFVWLLLFFVIVFITYRTVKAFFPSCSFVWFGRRGGAKDSDEEEEEEEEDDEEEVMGQGSSNGKSLRQARLSSGSTPLTSGAAHVVDVDDVSKPGVVSLETQEAAERLEWERRRHTKATMSAPRPAPADDDHRPGARASRESTCRRGSFLRANERLILWVVLLFLCLLFAYALTLGALALIYYFQEDSVLYGEAVVCPSDADEPVECKKDDVPIPCCDYTLQDDLQHSEQFLSIVVPPERRRTSGESGDASTRLQARIHTWLVEADSGGEFYSAHRPLYLIYTHGNIDNLSFSKKLYAWLAKDLGINVLAWDYPGFGKSSGVPSEQMLYKAIEKIFDYLVNKKRARPSDVILWGYSLGGAVSVHLANKHDVMGVILQAPIDSAMKVVAAELPLTGWACPNAITQPFDTMNSIKDLKTCLFVFVGADDDHFPPWREENLFKSALHANPTCKAFFKIEPYETKGQSYRYNHLSDPLTSHQLKLNLRKFLNKIINMTN